MGGGRSHQRRSKKKKKKKKKKMKLKHYSSGQEILLVGEGDFSFSSSLATAFCQASNITATSLDTYDVVVAKYAKAKANLETLEKMGATLLHGVDATKMKLHTDLKMRKFDRIIFNFPHAGFKGKEDQMRLINLHRHLVQGFFRHASRMLRPNGEVHVSHKMGFPFRNWNLEELASKNSLMLKECVDFKIKDYPGYNNKRGDGARCDQPFPLGKCCTYMFIIGNVHKKKEASGYNMGLVSRVSLSKRSEPNDGSGILTGNVLSPAVGYPLTEYMLNVESMQRVYSAPSIGITNAPMRVFVNQVTGDRSLFYSIQRRVYYPPMIGISGAAMRVFGNQLEDHDILSESIQGRAYSPPRIGMSSETMGVFGSGSFHRGVYIPPPILIGRPPMRGHCPELIHFNEEHQTINYGGYMH